jgi:hypothetical protein
VWTALSGRRTKARVDNSEWKNLTDSTYYGYGNLSHPIGQREANRALDLVLRARQEGRVCTFRHIKLFKMGTGCLPGAQGSLNQVHLLPTAPEE